MHVDIRESHRRAMCGIIAGMYRRFLNNSYLPNSALIRMARYHQKRWQA